MKITILIFALVLALLEVIRVYFLANYGNAKTILRMCLATLFLVIALPLTLTLIHPFGFFTGAVILLVYPYLAINTKIPKDESSDEYLLRKKWLQTYPIAIVIFAIGATIGYLL